MKKIYNTNTEALRDFDPDIHEKIVPVYGGEFLKFRIVPLRTTKKLRKALIAKAFLFLYHQHKDDDINNDEFLELLIRETCNLNNWQRSQGNVRLIKQCYKEYFTEA